MPSKQQMFKTPLRELAYRYIERVRLMSYPRPYYETPRDRLARAWTAGYYAGRRAAVKKEKP